MSLTVLTVRARRVVGVGVAAAVASLGVVAVPPVARGVSAPTSYTCTGDPAATLSVVLDTDAPARMRTGDSAAVVLTAATALPAAVAQQQYDAGARSFDGTIVTKAVVGGTALDVSHAIASTPIPARTEPAAVPFTATSAGLPVTAPAAPGPVAITAGDLVATLTFYTGSGTVVGGSPRTLTCAAPPGRPVAVDTIAVLAPSTTTLTLDRTASEHGQDVTATALVTTPAGPPDGAVAFSVDGLATAARVDQGGVATLLLPDLHAGTHRVTATFVPRDATTYDGSTTAPQVLSVARARTRARIPVTGRTTRVVTRVGVRVKGVFDTVPTGKVRITVKRIGRRGTEARVRTLDAGAATAGLGRLAKGRYRVTVAYRGDADHLALTKTKKFRVRRA